MSKKLKLEEMGISLSKELPTFDVPLDLVEPEETNPNRMNDGEFNRLVTEMEENGIIVPIQIAPKPGGKFAIIGGEHRWEGAKALGKKTIPCNILLDEKYADRNLRKLLMVRLNVIHGKTDKEKFVALYSDMAKVYGQKQLKALFGYTDTDAWKRLTKGVEDALRSTRIAGASSLADELRKKAGSAKSVDGLSAALNAVFKKARTMKNGYLVFSYGGKKHIHIPMVENLEKAMFALSEICEGKDIDMGELMAKIIVDWISAEAKADD